MRYLEFRPHLPLGIDNIKAFRYGRDLYDRDLVIIRSRLNWAVEVKTRNNNEPIKT